MINCDLLFLCVEHLYETSIIIYLDTIELITKLFTSYSDDDAAQGTDCGYAQFSNLLLSPSRACTTNCVPELI